MNTKLHTRILGTVVALVLTAAACGNGDGTSDASDGSAGESTSIAHSGSGSGDQDETGDQDDTADQNDHGDASVGGGASGTLTIGDETVELTEVLCHLEPQPAAAGGGNILLVVQGHGVDRAGEEVMIDFTRFDEESRFAGDAVQVYRGDILSGEAQELDTRQDAGIVAMDGSIASANKLILADLTTGTEVEVSFEIAC